MKKNIGILSIVASFTLLTTVSPLMASDTTHLTKATVKLIKSFHSMETQINGINNFSALNLEKIEKNRGDLDKNIKDLSKSNVDIVNNTQNINSNKQDINQIISSQHKVEEDSKKALKTANEMRKLIIDLKKVSLDFKNNSSKFINSADTAYKKSVQSQDKLNILETSVGNLSNKGRLTTIQSNQNKITINNLKSKYDKDMNAKDLKIEELESKIDSMNIQFNAEINILKAKFDRARPVYVLDKQDEGLINCVDSNCSSVSNDKILSDFVK